MTWTRIHHVATQGIKSNPYVVERVKTLWAASVVGHVYPLNTTPICARTPVCPNLPVLDTALIRTVAEIQQSLFASDVPIATASFWVKPRVVPSGTTAPVILARTWVRPADTKASRLCCLTTFQLFDEVLEERTLRVAEESRAYPYRSQAGARMNYPLRCI